MANIIGTIGVALLLAAFILNLLNVLRADGFAYSVINLLGAADRSTRAQDDPQVVGQIVDQAIVAHQ